MFMFFAISSLLGSSLYLYFSYPHYYQQFFMSFFWNLSIMRTRCDEIYDSIYKFLFPKVQECSKFIIYDTKTCEIENINIAPDDLMQGILESLKQMLNEKENEDKLVLFKTYVNESPYFVRIHNSTNLDDLSYVKLIKNPFLNVDLKYVNNNDKEETLNITNELKPYYVKGNILFDNNFISYFLNITYEIVNISNYSLEFIDNNCASLKFTHNDVITEEHVL